MTAYHGKQGKVEWVSAQVVGSVIDWTLEATCDVIETTVMSHVAEAITSHWKSYTATFKNWSGTFTVLASDGGLDPDLDADIAQDADGLALELFGGIVAQTGQGDLTTRKYIGNAMITDVAMSTDKEDVARITYTFQGSGTLTGPAAD